MTPTVLATTTLAAKEPNPLLPTWSELVLVAVIFGLLWFFIAKYVTPRFERAFQQRRDAIEGGIARAEQAQAEAQAMLARYQQQLTEARAEAAEIRENARADAQRIVDDLRRQAQDEAARIVQRGEEQLATQRGAIVRELRGDIGGLAVELSERIVDQRLSDDAQVRATVDAFLADLQQQDQQA